ncbi:hypothetical protein CY35_09G084500 [Sphagnum magellanicum]|nr:hypothetical protein CY35_09G084500 [Sphagnum magellanicum]
MFETSKTATRRRKRIRKGFIEQVCILSLEEETKKNNNNLITQLSVQLRRAMFLESSSQISFSGELTQITDNDSQQLAVMLSLNMMLSSTRLG